MKTKYIHPVIHYGILILIFGTALLTLGVYGYMYVGNGMHHHASSTMDMSPSH